MAAGITSKTVFWPSGGQEQLFDILKRSLNGIATLHLCESFYFTFNYILSAWKIHNIYLSHIDRKLLSLNDPSVPKDPRGVFLRFLWRHHKSILPCCLKYFAMQMQHSICFYLFWEYKFWKYSQSQQKVSTSFLMEQIYYHMMKTVPPNQIPPNKLFLFHAVLH